MNTMNMNLLTKSQNPRTWPLKPERNHFNPVFMFSVMVLREKPKELRDSRALKSLKWETEN